MPASLDLEQPEGDPVRWLLTSQRDTGNALDGHSCVQAANSAFALWPLCAGQVFPWPRQCTATGQCWGQQRKVSLTCPLCIQELLLHTVVVLFLSSKLQKGGTVPFVVEVLSKPLRQGYLPKRGEPELVSRKLQTGLASAGCETHARRLLLCPGLCMARARALQPAPSHPCWQSMDV